MFPPLTYFFKPLEYFFRRNPTEKIVERFKEDGQDNLITYEDLKKIPVNESFEINTDEPGSVITRRLDTADEEKTLSFRVIMAPHQEWALHKHDCKEVILMYKGICIDEVNQNELKAGYLYQIAPHTNHKIVSLDEQTIFYVEFTR